MIWFGGICCVPSAVLTSERTIASLVNDVIMTHNSRGKRQDC
jgi:hypothetical protein